MAYGMVAPRAPVGAGHILKYPITEVQRVLPNILFWALLVSTIFFSFLLDFGSFFCSNMSLISGRTAVVVSTAREF